MVTHPLRDNLLEVFGDPGGEVLLKKFEGFLCQALDSFMHILLTKKSIFFKNLSYIYILKPTSNPVQPG